MCATVDPHLAIAFEDIAVQGARRDGCPAYYHNGTQDHQDCQRKGLSEALKATLARRCAKQK